jgi:hypothetical protein
VRQAVSCRSALGVTVSDTCDTCTLQVVRQAVSCRSAKTLWIQLRARLELRSRGSLQRTLQRLVKGNPGHGVAVEVNTWWDSGGIGCWNFRGILENRERRTEFQKDCMHFSDKLRYGCERLVNVPMSQKKST